MKTSILFLLFSFSITVSSWGQQLSTANDSLSYTLGVLFGKSLVEGGYENINMDIFVTALRAAVKKESTVMSTEVCEH